MQHLQQIYQLLNPHQASLAFLVSGQAQHGFKGFFCSVPSMAGAVSTLAAERLDISTGWRYLKRIVVMRDTLA